MTSSPPTCIMCIIKSCRQKSGWLHGMLTTTRYGLPVVLRRRKVKGGNVHHEEASSRRASGAAD